ncbi:MAG TPA: glutamate--tRNA ligase family protein, partial [Candidatus Dormibacteraeota bacterium]|nr:glutamate--tRNA ligase family protein [Candidatus Dormibacteraeota bacterium]
VFTDMVRGEMRFDSNLIGDFIIVKSDGYPTYQFASPVDDALMRITHVIRGEEHLSNTPYQLMLIDALGYERPQAYAHMPLILAADGSKLSKRKHPESNLMLFRDLGYMPEALLNYLALLGWNPGTERELFTLDELVGVFSFERVQHAGARFDWEKLNWLNGEYIRKLSIDELVGRCEPFVPQVDQPTLRKAAPALQTRLHKLAQAIDYLDFLWTEPAVPQLDVDAARRVRAAIDAVRDVDWTPEAIETALERAVADSGVGKGKFYTPLRDVLTGKKVALPIHYCFGLLPKEVALARLEHAAKEVA